MSSAKRKPALDEDSNTPKAKRVKVDDYHLTPSVKEQGGGIQWPAPRSQINRAREIILESARSNRKVLIIPDKDADGLSSGAILRHTLMLLGLPEQNIDVHLLSKGNTVHSPEERAKMGSNKPAYVFVLDQGSRAGPPLIDEDHVGLVIDHHYATPTDFPSGSEHVSACDSPPVATSSLLTYHLCEPLHPEVASRCDWLCIVGTHGDLGNTFKWEPPFPEMAHTLKKYTKKVLNDVVSLVNAPRRTSTYDVRSAWEALRETSDPASILKSTRLLAARREVNDEVERCTHAAPKFSADGKVAVFRIKSQAQVHPVIATRWAGHLQSKSLEIVLVANEGYLPDKVNFSCRIPRCARNRAPSVDIIRILKAYASLPEAQDNDEEGKETGGFARRPPLLERLGDNFARGHVQASGGIVAVDEFEELMKRMQIGVKPANKQSDSGSAAKSAKKNAGPGQKNTLLTYFKKNGRQ